MTQNPITDEAIDQFWDWFETVVPALDERIDEPSVLPELDARVKEFGSVSWEVGPAASGANQLVITPDGAADQLAVTERIVARAPKLPGWEIHPAKPPKQWTRRFTMRTEDGAALPIDASHWRYRLYEFSDGTYDIDIWAPELADVGASLRTTAARIALDAELGERRRVLLIGGISIEATAEPSSPLRAGNLLAQLSDHLASLDKSIF